MFTFSGMRMAENLGHEQSVHPARDAECLQAVDKPVHTHKQRKSSSSGKSTRSRSTSGTARSQSTPNRKPSNSRKATKRKQSRSRSASTPTKLKRSKKASKPLHHISKLRCKPKSSKLKASIHRPRALGRKKSILFNRKSKPNARSVKRAKPINKKKEIVKKYVSDKKSKRMQSTNKQIGVGLNKCYVLTTPLKHAGQKRKQSTSSKVKSYKKARLTAKPPKARNIRPTPKKTRLMSTTNKRERSKSRKPSSLTQTPRKLAHSQKRAVTVHFKRRRSTSSHKGSSQSGGHGQCNIKPRPVSSIWKSRLRPRPLKSARYTCYRPSCLIQLPISTPMSTAKPKAQTSASKQKLKKIQKQERQSTIKAKTRSTKQPAITCGGKNSNSIFRLEEDDDCAEQWYNTEDVFHESNQTQPDDINCNPTQAVDQSIPLRTIASGRPLIKSSGVSDSDGDSTTELAVESSTA